MDLYRLPSGPDVPFRVHAVVEVPKNTRNKVEYDPEWHIFRIDRVLYSPVRYPGDYGFVPSTHSLDGDALDVLVMVTEPTFTGCVITVRPVGMLEMTDEAGCDIKILAVPARDPRYEEIQDLHHIPKHLLTEIRYFFQVYKDLEGKETAVLDWHPVEQAYEAIIQSIQAFRDLASPQQPSRQNKEDCTWN